MSLQRAAESKLIRMLAAYGAALMHETAQHGLPNSYSVSELAREYFHLRPRDGYHLGHCRVRELQKVLIQLGCVATVSYVKGRFHLAKREWHGCIDPRGHNFNEGVCQNDRCFTEIKP